MKLVWFFEIFPSYRFNLICTLGKEKMRIVTEDFLLIWIESNQWFKTGTQHYRGQVNCVTRI